MTRYLLDTDTLSHVWREPSGTVARLQDLPLDDRVAMAYADVRPALEQAGTPSPPNDLWMAAHALAGERMVVTGNVREFRRVAGLGVED